MDVLRNSCTGAEKELEMLRTSSSSCGARRCVLYSITYNLLYMVPSVAVTAVLPVPLFGASDAASPGRDRGVAR